MMFLETLNPSVRFPTFPREITLRDYHHPRKVDQLTKKSLTDKESHIYTFLESGSTMSVPNLPPLEAKILEGQTYQHHPICMSMKVTKFNRFDTDKGAIPKVGSPTR